MGIQIDLDKTQRYLDWIKKMLYLDTIADKAKHRVVKRGQVYNCNLGVGVGSEESKERPCVILQGDIANSKSSNTIVAPITHSGSKLPVVVQIADKFNPNGECILDGYALLGNIVCVSKARLGDYRCDLTADEMKEIDKAISISVDVKRHYDKLTNILNDKLDYIKKLQNKVKNMDTDIKAKDADLAILKEVQSLLKVAEIKDIPKEIAKLLKK